MCSCAYTYTHTRHRYACRIGVWSCKRIYLFNVFWPYSGNSGKRSKLSLQHMTYDIGGSKPLDAYLALFWCIHTYFRRCCHIHSYSGMLSLNIQRILVLHDTLWPLWHAKSGTARSIARHCLFQRLLYYGRQLNCIWIECKRVWKPIKMLACLKFRQRHSSYLIQLFKLNFALLKK